MLSVDTKKKERVGNFKNPGRTWRPRGQPSDVNLYDYPHLGAYPTAEAVLLCADGGGSNGSRNRAWKYHLQQWADLLGVDVTVCHSPPGTSKWNKIEHRLFSYISLHRTFPQWNYTLAPH